MAEDKFEPREINFRQWLPWTQIFRGFWIALDHKKLLLAAAGILVMAIGWYFLAAFSYSIIDKPDYAKGLFEAAKYGSNDLAYKAFKRERNGWNLLHEAAGPHQEWPDAGDLADTLDEYNLIQVQFQPEKTLTFIVDGQPREIPGEKNFEKINEQLGTDRSLKLKVGERTYDVKPKPYGRMRTWPWFEDRGPNPFLLVTGNAGQRDPSGIGHYVPWRRGEFAGPLDWFLGEQVPVLLEPLVKLLRPVRYFLHPNAGYKERFYFLLVLIWTVATWAIFGGAITRIAAVEIARNEKIGLGEAIRFTVSRWQSYIFASFFPLIIIAAIVILLMLFSLVDLIPIVKELWNGLLWWLALAGGLAIAVLLVGLVGWPMIHATLSTEGSDSFDALSRSYSYVLQKPWSYIWYAVVALAYGAVVVFFVGLMGSLMVYLAKWGVTHTPGYPDTYADTSYMFVWTPTSYHWRDLLLQGTPVAQGAATIDDTVVSRYMVDPEFRGWNYIGAFLVAFWLYLVFLLIVGYGYSYFWSASTMIYLLMRRKVDDTEMDEVYLEEEDSDEPYSTTTTSAASPTPASGTPIQLVEPPVLRQSSSSPAPATSPPAGENPAPKPGDGEASTGEGASS